MDYKNYHIASMEKSETFRIFTCNVFAGVVDYLNTHTHTHTHTHTVLN
jgi:hypothetical protein